jgi:hypothetical protein
MCNRGPAGLVASVLGARNVVESNALCVPAVDCCKESGLGLGAPCSGRSFVECVMGGLGE